MFCTYEYRYIFSYERTSVRMTSQSQLSTISISLISLKEDHLLIHQPLPPLPVVLNRIFSQQQQTNIRTDRLLFVTNLARDREAIHLETMTSIIRRKILLGGFTILLINCANNRYLLIDATQELSIAPTSSIRLNESYHRQHHSQYYDRRHPLQVDDSMQTRRDKLYEIRGEDKIRGIVSSSVRGGGAGVFMLGGDAGVRTVASIVMLGIVTLIVKVFREQGIYGLLLLFQAVMYKEACQVVGARDRVSADTSFVPIKVQQIWWFLTALAGSSLHHLKVFGPSNLYGNLVTYLMAAVGLVMGVLTMAQDGASEELFRGYLGKVASSHFALIFLVWQSSTWFLTLQEFGIAWFLLPALLVIVNDTMAYVFGRLFGNHKLIPNLSP